MDRRPAPLHCRAAAAGPGTDRPALRAAGDLSERRRGGRPAGPLGLQGRQPHSQVALGVRHAGNGGEGPMTAAPCRWTNCVLWPTPPATAICRRPRPRGSKPCSAAAPQAQQFYLAYVRLDGCLRWEFGNRALGDGKTRSKGPEGRRRAGDAGQESESPETAERSAERNRQRPIPIPQPSFVTPYSELGTFPSFISPHPSSFILHPFLSATMLSYVAAALDPRPRRSGGVGMGHPRWARGGPGVAVGLPGYAVLAGSQRWRQNGAAMSWQDCATDQLQVARLRKPSTVVVRRAASNSFPGALRLRISRGQKS